MVLAQGRGCPPGPPVCGRCRVVSLHGFPQNTCGVLSSGTGPVYTEARSGPWSRQGQLGARGGRHMLGREPRVWEWGMGASTCQASLPPRLTLCSVGAVRRPREARPLSGCAISPLPSPPLPSGAFWGGMPSQPGPVPIDFQVPAWSVWSGTRVEGVLAGLPSQPLSSPAF